MQSLQNTPYKVHFSLQLYQPVLLHFTKYIYIYKYSFSAWAYFISMFVCLFFYCITYMYVSSSLFSPKLLKRKPFVKLNPHSKILDPCLTMSNFEKLWFCQKIDFQHQTSSCMFSMPEIYIYRFISNYWELWEVLITQTMHNNSHPLLGAWCGKWLC